MSDAPDPRLEALRLAIAVRQYLATPTAFLLAPSTAYELRAQALKDAEAIERTLATLALGTLAEIPAETLLLVALDRALAQGVYSDVLREHVARHLRGLKLCTSWYDEPFTNNFVVRDCGTGEDICLIEENDDGTCSLWLNAHGSPQQFGLQRAEAERRAAEWLKREGWVQAPGPKEAP